MRSKVCVPPPPPFPTKGESMTQLLVRIHKFFESIPEVYAWSNKINEVCVQWPGGQGYMKWKADRDGEVYFEFVKDHFPAPKDPGKRGRGPTLPHPVVKISQ